MVCQSMAVSAHSHMHRSVVSSHSCLVEKGNKSENGEIKKRNVGEGKEGKKESPFDPGVCGIGSGLRGAK